LTLTAVISYIVDHLQTGDREADCSTISGPKFLRVGENDSLSLVLCFQLFASVDTMSRSVKVEIKIYAK